MKRTNRGFHQIIVFFVCFAVFCVSTPLWAQSAEEEAMLGIASEAVAFYKEGSYEQAIEKFEQAYALFPDANLLFNVARCYQLMGKDEKAVDYYTLFIRHPEVSGQDKKKAMDYLLELQQGKTDDQDTPPEPESEAVSDAEAESVSQSAQAEPTKRKRIPEWSLIGAGGASLIVGGIFGGLALKNQGDFDSTTDLDSQLDYKDKIETYAIVADVFIAVGAAAVATGIILFFVLDDREGKEQETYDISYAPFFTKNSGGAAINLSF